MRDEAEAGYHYRVIARAIALLDGEGGKPRSLDSLARDLDLSPSHFQRLFRAWVGISPKRYQQYLALGYARELLAGNFTTLDVAEKIGLSGTGRLHDLFVTWEAMSPGEYARAGAGLEIRYGWFDSHFGAALGMTTQRGLCGLAFADAPRDAQVLADMARRWPRAVLIEDPDAAQVHVRTALDPGGQPRLHLMGTPLQIKVWEALLHIPPAYVTSYARIAQCIGKPGAARAVGTAVGRNPLGFVIPCHRCLRSTGELGGYHWGVTRKRAMLGWEGARHEASLAAK